MTAFSLEKQPFGGTVWIVSHSNPCGSFVHTFSNIQHFFGHRGSSPGIGNKNTYRRNMYRYLVNNTANVSNDVYWRMMTTTCFGLFRPSSGLHLKEY